MLLLVSLILPVFGDTALTVNDNKGAAKEWGFRPDSNSTIEVTPPPFCWRPQSGAQEYELQASRTTDFTIIDYTVSGIELNVHCPPQIFKSGKWYWRFRFRAKQDWSEWSQVRTFSIADDARPMPLPTKAELLKRIPKTHPRLFMRPEEVANLRKKARTDLQKEFASVLKTADSLLKLSIAAEEPPDFPKGIKRKTPEWLKLHRNSGNLAQTTLSAAAELSFAWLLSGNAAYGEEARRILMKCATWDPAGSTGFRTNDNAAMLFNFYFSRAYTFLHDLLSKEERQQCRRVMRVRGNDMYKALYPRHLWRPYASHSNRTWHFLGEVAIAFYGEIPEAGDWAWFAMNVFANVYPVWNDSNGGWHEGMAYWYSYLNRFTWWADIMRSAFDINAYDKPFFAECGYFPMYVMPPGTRSGGFGDQTPRYNSQSCARLVANMATQARNPYWSWYGKIHGINSLSAGSIGFIRSSLPEVTPKAPNDLPRSRLFRGVGQAYLNTDLVNATNNIQVHFKSSPFGTQSHGYNAQNSFLLYIGGERLFLRSGLRDCYGSEHHKNWMWHTRSDNNITVNGTSQLQHSADAVGHISQFQSTEGFDYVVGEAHKAYAGKLNRYTRRILFIKPEIIIIWDSLTAPRPSSFEWHLHTAKAMLINSSNKIYANNSMGGCTVEFLQPTDLNLSLTDKFVPPPWSKVKLIEHHLTAVSPVKSEAVDFITVLRPHLGQEHTECKSEITKLEDDYHVTTSLSASRTVQVTLHATTNSVDTDSAADKHREVSVVIKQNGTVESHWHSSNLQIQPEP